MRNFSNAVKRHVKSSLVTQPSPLTSSDDASRQAVADMPDENTVSPPTYTPHAPFAVSMQSAILRVAKTPLTVAMCCVLTSSMQAATLLLIANAKTRSPVHREPNLLSPHSIVSLLVLFVANGHSVAASAGLRMMALAVCKRAFASLKGAASVAVHR